MAHLQTLFANNKLHERSHDGAVLEAHDIASMKDWIDVIPKRYIRGNLSLRSGVSETRRFNKFARFRLAAVSGSPPRLSSAL